MHAYSFWSENGMADSGAAPYNSLNVRPDGNSGSDMSVQFSSHMALDEQLSIADRVLAGVQQWRDSIAEQANQQRTAADGLEAARTEIARLKAEAGEAA